MNIDISEKGSEAGDDTGAKILLGRVKRSQKNGFNFSVAKWPDPWAATVLIVSFYCYFTGITTTET